MFSENRHGRFRECELLRHPFQTTVARCIEEGLVIGQRMAIDPTLIEAETNWRWNSNGFVDGYGLENSGVSRALPSQAKIASGHHQGSRTMRVHDFSRAARQSLRGPGRFWSDPTKARKVFAVSGIIMGTVGPKGRSKWSKLH